MILIVWLIHYNTYILHLFSGVQLLFQIWIIIIPSWPNQLSFPTEKSKIVLTFERLLSWNCTPIEFQYDTLVKILIHGVKNHKANGSLMMAQWGVAPSAALHPVPECACLTDTSYTGYHCSLRVDWCSQWVMLAGTSMVLHVCCSTACPQVTFLCVCMCASVCAFEEEDKDEMITTSTEQTKPNLR